MNSKQAAQLLTSKRHVTVYYKNTPVLIQEVFPKVDKARVRNLNTNKEMVVPVKTINEHHGSLH